MSNILVHLFIVNITFVHFGHLIQETTSFKEFSFLISFPSTFITKSHHLSHAFSDGDPGIGEIILIIQGFSIST